MYQKFVLSAFADEADSSINRQIEALRRNGISFLEIRGVDGVNISKITTEKAKEVREKLDRAGIGVWSIGSPIGKIHRGDDLDQHFREYENLLKCTETLGAKRIRMFSFYPKKGEDVESVREYALESLEKLIALTPDDVVLCHENEKGIFGQNAENCLLLHKTFPRLRAVFDPANFVQCGVDTLKAWEMLSPYVDYMHVKDANADGAVVPPGEGLGQLPALFGKFDAMGGGTLTLEPHLSAFVGLKALENGESLKHGAHFDNSEEAFDFAANSLKKLIFS